MKIKILILIVLFTSCKSKLNLEKTEIKKNYSTKLKKNDFYALEYFKNEYQRKNYSRCLGNISVETYTDDGIVNIGSLKVNLDLKNVELNRLITEGILSPTYLSIYPTNFLPNETNLEITICCFEYLDFIDTYENYRYYRFWVFQKGFANAREYLIELKNTSSDKSTKLSKFIDNVEITHLSEPKIII